MTQPKKHLTPLKAIRAKCQDCLDIEDCGYANLCDLYDHRVGQLRYIKGPTPLQSIRKHCLWCRANEDGIKRCKVTFCKLHIYRSGYTPKSKNYWV